MVGRYRTLVDLFEGTCAAHAARPALGTKSGAGWEWLTYGELHQRATEFRAGLASLGVIAGDRVAIVSNNRVEWAVAAYAAYGLGAAVVPLYEKQRASECEFILRDSEAKIAIAGTRQIASELLEIKPRLTELREVVCASDTAGAHSDLSALMAVGRAAPVPVREPEPDAMAALLYTSGTTGKPKGVILTHANITHNVNAARELFDFSEVDRSLSFIPWAHAFGHTCELHTMLSLGASIAINDDVARLPSNLVEIKPTILVAVPRIFNKLFVRIQQRIAETPGVLRRIVGAAVRGETRRNRGERTTAGERLATLVADPTVFAKARASLGGHLKYAISGGAALAPEVAEFIQALGIRVYEGYGLTETSPLVSANRPGKVRIGSVGAVIPGVSERVDHAAGAREGELVVFGPNVMKGYHNRPEDQARAMTPDGGFRTGDLGYLDPDGFLYVTGRIKEQYKLENGKYVAPAPLEEQLQLSPFIANAVVHGANRPHNVALVALNVEAVQKWASEHGIALADIATDGRVRRLIAEEISLHSAGFREYERPRDFVITADDFTPENELLTPSLKLKRPSVMARYGKALEGLYGANPHR
jgi:long-chain acyl-CoA synthetase